MLVALARVRLLSDGRRQHRRRTDCGVPRPDGRRDPRHLRDAARWHSLVGAGPGQQDGWKINGCPVNGPAIAARGRNVAVAWFTMQGGQGRAYIAFSSDAGRTFRAPIRVDDAGSTGRVQVELLADGSAAVSWIEFGKGPSQLKVRTVGASGTRGPAGRHRRWIGYTIPPDGRREGRARLRVDRKFAGHHAPLHGTRKTSATMNMLRWSIAAAALPSPPVGAATNRRRSSRSPIPRC